MPTTTFGVTTPVDCAFTSERINVVDAKESKPLCFEYARERAVPHEGKTSHTRPRVAICNIDRTDRKDGWTADRGKTMRQCPRRVYASVSINVHVRIGSLISAIGWGDDE